MKKFAILIIVSMLSAAVAAQNYNWAIGVRGGAQTSGISTKINFNPTNSLELILDLAHGVNGYALAQWNIPVIAQGFNFYYGAGAHIGQWKKHGYHKFTFGIDGMIGLEYKIQNIPLVLSVDYKPALNLIGQTIPLFVADDLALSVRVCF